MAATSAEPRGLDPLTLLRSGGEAKAAVMNPLDIKLDGVGTNAKNAIELAKNLRGIAKANSREAIENIAALKDGESKFELRNTGVFMERFGSGLGIANVNKMTPSEIASYNTAEQILRENAKIALYLDLRSKIKSEQAVLLKDPQIIDAIGVPNPTYDQIRSQALSAILKNATFINAFPEIGLSTMSQAEKMQYIEATLLPAEDNRFAARLGTLTQEAYRKAVDFTTVAGDDKKTGMEQQEKLEKARMDQRVKSITETLNLKGIVKPAGGAYVDADIVTIINGAGNPNLAVNAIVSDIMGVSPHVIVDLQEYVVNLPKEKLRLEQNIIPKLSGVGFNQFVLANANDQDVKALLNVMAQQKILGDLYDSSVNAGVTAANAKALHDYNQVGRGLLSDQGFSTIASEAKQSQSKAADLALQISVLPPGDPAEVAKSRDKRLLEEQDLIGQLDRVLGNSLRDVLLERYDIMEERQGRLMEKNAKDAEKDVAKLVLELKKKMNKNWISWDNSTTPQRKVDKKQIREDVTHLTFSADKDVALKQLIARDLFPTLGNRYSTLNIIDGTNGAGITMLNVDQLDQLNKVFESSGQAYKEKLWADMFMGRGTFDKTINLGFGIELGGDANESLAFKKAVREEMMRKYEPEITKSIESNKESSQAMKNLEAQGIKFDFNMKWLWYVLTILLGLPVAAVGSVALPAGIAAAQAAAGGIAATGLTASAIEGAIGGAAGLAVPTAVGSVVGGKLASALEG